MGFFVNGCSIDYVNGLMEHDETQDFNEGNREKFDRFPHVSYECFVSRGAHSYVNCNLGQLLWLRVLKKAKYYQSYIWFGIYLDCNLLFKGFNYRSRVWEREEFEFENVKY